MKLSVKRLTASAKLPTKAHESDAGWDIYADEDVEIRPGETMKVRTGIAAQLDEGLDHGWDVPVNLIWDRSSLGCKGVHRLAGVIDYGFRNEYIVVLTNLNILPVMEIMAMYAGSPECFERYKDALDIYSYKIKKGDKIAQVLTQKVSKVTIVEAEDLTDAERGLKGFGSSGS